MVGRFWDVLYAMPIALHAMVPQKMIVYHVIMEINELLVEKRAFAKMVNKYKY
jgi:hypothetical protein